MTDHSAARTELEQKHAQLSTRLEKIRADIRRRQGPLDADFSEQATELENNEVLDELEIQTRQELTKVAAALDRIDAGKYGICVVCEESIGAARLGAIPFATRCIECAARAESAA